MRGYDAWVTRGPDYDEPMQPRCVSCGAFLSYAPSGSEVHEDLLTCDGSVTEVDTAYDPISRDILGLPEGATYKVVVAACGFDVTGPHEPHSEVLGGAISSRWDCRKCGAKTIF